MTKVVVGPRSSRYVQVDGYRIFVEVDLDLAIKGRKRGRAGVAWLEVHRRRGPNPVVLVTFTPDNLEDLHCVIRDAVRVLKTRHAPRNESVVRLQRPRRPYRDKGARDGRSSEVKE
jgi:hypothetical protein